MADLILSPTMKSKDLDRLDSSGLASKKIQLQEARIKKGKDRSTALQQKCEHCATVAKAKEERFISLKRERNESKM